MGGAQLGVLHTQRDGACRPPTRASVPPTRSRELAACGVGIGIISGFKSEFLPLFSPQFAGRFLFLNLNSS